LLPLAVELIQTVLPGHYCTIANVHTNGAGELPGVASPSVLVPWSRPVSQWDFTFV
jgi:hypothetical protein